MSNPSRESVPCEPGAMAEDLVRALRALEGRRALATPPEEKLPGASASGAARARRPNR
jgi:hypothetical protein